MAKKQINARIVHKHDTAENWAKAANFVPLEGELIIYDVDSSHSYTRFKIGDGKTLVYELPFSSYSLTDVTELPTEHINENTIYRVEHSKQRVDLYGIGILDVPMRLEDLFVNIVPGADIKINTILVDELPETLEPEQHQDGTTTFTFYVVNSTGIAYMHDTTEGAVTVGAAIGFDEEFEEENLDRGWSDNILSETDPGIYSVLADEVFYTYCSLKNGVVDEFVTAIDGKGLSTNDFTDKDKNTLLWLAGNGSKGLTYSIIGENTCMIVGIGSCTDIDVIVPRIIDGYLVTGISDGAFSYLDTLGSITIPDSVNTIGYAAFADCLSIRSVTLPDSVTTVSNEAFARCPNLTSVTIGNSVTNIGEYAFKDCSNLTSITIPDSVTTIGSYAFENCYNLMSVTIGNSVTTIGRDAFHGCSNLTSVTIPDSVTTIGSGTFYGCPNLTIYCEASSKPDGWDNNWNLNNRPVVWGAALDFADVNNKLIDITANYVTQTYVDNKITSDIATLKEELKTYIEQLILGGEW